MLPIRSHLLQFLAVVIFLAESKNVIKVKAQDSGSYPTSPGTNTNPNSSAATFPKASSLYKSNASNVGSADVPLTFFETGGDIPSSPKENFIHNVITNIGNGLTGFLSNLTHLEPKNRCQKDLMRALKAAKSKEHWALEFFDSWGKPSNSFMKFEFSAVGRYDQCRDVVAPSEIDNRTGSYKGEYCVVSIEPVFKDWVKNYVLFDFGICMPDTCSEDDITNLANATLEELNLAENVTAKSTECRSEEREVTAATVICIIIISIVGFLIFGGTILDVVLIQWPKWTASSGNSGQLPEESDNQEPGLNSCKAESQVESNDKGQTTQSKSTLLCINEGKLTATNGETQGYPNGEKESLIMKKHSNLIEGVPVKVLLSFSIYSNWVSLMDTSHKPGAMTSINGIRVITMLWIYLVHLVMWGYKIGDFTSHMGQYVYQARMFDFFVNGTFSVDTFFTLSGLLTSYCLYKEVLTNGWKVNWKKVFLHRYLRLTPPYMAVILITLGLQRFMGYGAKWANTQPWYQSHCEKNWWTHILYVNNLIDPNKTCSIHFWYLPVDMQLFLLTPFLLIPFHYNRYAGLGSCGFFLVLNWIITGAMSTYNEWGASLSQYFAPLFFGEGRIVYSGDNFQDYFVHYYQASYNRAGPFIVGIVAGHFLAAYKGRIPLRWDISILGWVIAVSTGIALIYGIHDDLEVKHFNNSMAAFYSLISRSVWSVCVCWVITACTAGYGGPINTFLSWSPFIALSRITYMLYLIQIAVFDVYFANMDQVIALNYSNLSTLYVGLIMISSMISAALVLAFESPFVKLEKVLL